MSNNYPQKRLDEILVEQGAISEEQIRDALMRQKAHGGRFGSQLLYHRYINETTLVKALATQFECQGVVLSDYDIPDMLINMVPKKVAISRKIIPFDYNPETNLLKLACEDPYDQSMIQEMNFVSRGKNLEFYVAAELALNATIAKYYMHQNISLDDHLLLDIPDALTETGKDSPIISDNKTDKASAAVPTILLLTDEVYTTKHIIAIFERDGYEVITSNTTDEALDCAKHQALHTIFVRDTVPGDHLDMIDRIRKLSPSTIIQYYHDITSIMLGGNIATPQSEMLIKNHDLVTSLLSLKFGLPGNHSGRVGRYVDNLCRKINLSETDRVIITNAAYLHDFARYYYRVDNNIDNRQVIELTVRLLTSLKYHVDVVEILRCMYDENLQSDSDTLSVEQLGGNILTIVDLFCDNVQDDESISLSKMESLKTQFRNNNEGRFIPEVAEAFIGMVQEEFLERHTAQRKPQIIIYKDDQVSHQPLDWRLRNEGFRTVSVNTFDKFVELFNRSIPEIVVFAFNKKEKRIREFLVNLFEMDIPIKDSTVFLLVNSSLIPKLTDLLEQGIEDIIPNTENLDLLAVKLRRIKTHFNSHQSDSVTTQMSGTQGHLHEMNLIDLIQALGPGRKTVKITVRPDESVNTELILFLKEGQITYASIDDIKGHDAVYEGLCWENGDWVIESVGYAQIPEPNIFEPNESLLMEGCRLIDERLKSEELV